MLFMSVPGVQSSVHTATFACKRGGEIMVIGVGRAVMDGLPFMHLSLAEVSFSMRIRVLLTRVYN